MTNKRWLPYLGLCVCIAVVFGRVLGHEFLVWDDNLHVSENPRLHPPSLDALGRFWAAPYQGMYVPVAYTLFLLEAAFSRVPDPLVYHAVNLALHALASCLVCALVLACVRDPLAAFLGALLFALHPLQVESVAWISETRGTLAACFALFALERFCKHAIGPSASAGASAGASALRRDGVIASVAFALALLAKPSVVCVPIFALVLGLALGCGPRRLVAAWVLPGLLLAALAVVGTKLLQSDESLQVVPSVFERLWIACDALSFYLRKLLWPAELGADYGRSPAIVMAQGSSAWLAAIVIAAALAITLELRRHGRSEGLLGLTIFCVGLMPVLGFVPFGFQDISTVADRYAYLALLGPALAVAIAVARARRRTAASAPVIVAVIAASACALLSFRQAGVWHDTASLFEHALAVNPRSWVAHDNLGLVELARGDRVTARAEFERVLELRPEHPKAHNNLGIVASLEGQLDEARAHFERALQAKPNYARAHANLAALHARAGRPREAEEQARSALQLEPEDAQLWAALGELLAREGRTSDAIECFENALELRPQRPEVRAALERERRKRAGPTPTDG